jgi:hypothetical protein
MSKSLFTIITITPHQLATEAGLTAARIYQLLDDGTLPAQRRQVTRTEYAIPRIVADEFIASRRAKAA